MKHTTIHRQNHLVGLRNLRHEERWSVVNLWIYLIYLTSNLLSNRIRRKCSARELCGTELVMKQPSGTHNASSRGESTHEVSISKTPHGFSWTAPALIIATAAGSIATSTTKNTLDIRLEGYWIITNESILWNSGGRHSPMHMIQSLHYSAQLVCSAFNRTRKSSWVGGALGMNVFFLGMSSEKWCIPVMIPSTVCDTV